MCYWLRLLIASQTLGAEKLQPLADEADAIKRILAQIILNTKRNSKHRDQNPIHHREQRPQFLIFHSPFSYF